MQSSSRNGARVRVLAVHTTEGIMRALDLRNWTAWAGSSHASADETGALLTPADGFVAYDRAAWTLRSGNPWSENIELCGMAGWTRPQWLSRPKLLDACARWLADRSKARGIPLVKLTPQQYRAGASGVIGHNDHSVGYSDGTHWDPGPGFPWDVVLAKANAYRNGTQEDEDMTPEQDKMLRDTHNRVMGMLRQRWYVVEDGRLREVAADAPGAIPAHALDQLDGNWLTQLITNGTQATIGEVSSAFHQEADRDAANQAALSTQLTNVGGGDPAVLAAALKSALGETLAADVAARLTVTAG